MDSGFYWFHAFGGRVSVALSSADLPRLDPVIEVELFPALQASHIHEQVGLVEV